ncbi:hypothetical protein L4F33_17845 [Vibrio paracholerae]|nr:hypothetical protein [Vibrio paracholerae]
MKRQCIWRYKF